MLNLLIKDFKLIFPTQKDLKKRVLSSIFYVLAFVCFVALETFLFYRIVSSAPAKRFSAFLCGVVGFLYILFIPVMANYWRNRNFQIDIYQSWGWYVVIVVYLAYLVFIIVDLILTIKKEKRELSIEE